MNKQDKNRYLLSFVAGLLVLTGLFMPALSVRSEDDGYLGGGKHNGTVAVDPIGEEEGYSAFLYNNLNGLPTSEANDIVETADGFIWIGSYGGLIRYDGSDFVRMDSTTGITSVKCLYVDSRDRLWIGTNDNGLFMMDLGELHNWNRESGLKSASVQSLAEDEKGRILVSTTAGLAIVDEQLELSMVDDPRISDSFLNELRPAADGTIYGLTNDGEVFRIIDGKIDRFYSFASSPIRGISCIFPDPEDPELIYVETLDSQIYHGSLDNDFRDAEEIDISPLSQVMSFGYFDGRIWLCTRNGIGVIEGNAVKLLKNVPMDNSVGSMMTDYEGNLWFTSSRQGVMKIVKNRFVDIFERYGLSRKVVNSTCMYEDMLYVATDSGLYVLKDGETVDSIPLNKAMTASGVDLGTDDLLELLQGRRIRSLILDSRDRLWISSWRCYGLLCYDHGDLLSFNTDEGIFSDTVRSVHERMDGTILVACTGGINVIRGDKVIASYGEAEGIANTEILCVEEGAHGELIAGTDGDGIYVVDGNDIIHIGIDEGLTSGAIMRIKHDPIRKVFWIVTGNSLAYMDEEYRVTTVSNFPYSNNFDLYENSRGEMWVLSSNGIYIANTDDLIRNEQIDTVHFSLSTGLPYVATANSYSDLTEEGDLYIAGGTGVVKVNIEAPLDNVNDLIASVPYLEADGVKIYADENGRFTVPANTRKLNICAHVFTYSLIEPLISYRLDGFDKHDTTGYSSEIFPIYYTNLPGGTYDFIMEITDSMGQSSKGLSVQIVRKRAFYEQLWFYAAVLLGIGLLAYRLIKAYMKKRMDEMERQHREDSEKKRITRELTMANDIQQSMLPHVFPPFPERKEFDIYATMDPAREVGGDFYDFFMTDEDHLGLVMADVSGKGIPGALFMMASKIILQSIAMLGGSPEEILTKMNEALCSDNKAEMFVTVWVGILEISTGKLTAANAGHEYPIIKYPEGDFEILKDRHGFVVGGMANIRYHEYQLDLRPGTKLFLYTDGIPEATDSSNGMFGMERLLEALNTAKESGPERILESVRQAVNDFVDNAEQFDDLTMMCLEYKGKEDKENEE